MRLTAAILLGVAAALGGAPASFAADVAKPAAVPAKPVVVVPNWTGCYVGVNGGGGWTQNNVNDEGPGHAPIAVLNANNVVGGGQVGCDIQHGAGLIIGLQGMFDATNISGDAPISPPPPSTLHGSIPWFATATVRVGYLLAPAWMVYARGGAAWDRTDARLLSGGATVSSVSFTETGATAGLGTEWLVKPNVSLFAEYDYLGFGAKTVHFSSGDTGSVNQNINVALFGANIRFHGLH